MKFHRLGLVALLSVLTSCGIGGYAADAPAAAESSITIRLTNDDEAPVDRATFHATSGWERSTDNGVLDLVIDQPTAGVIRADGHLDQPIVIDSSTPDLDVSLWRVSADDGTPRFAMHFAGDTMMGRRYLEPARSGTATVSVGDDGASAAAVVDDIAPIFEAAALSMLNLETAIGRAPVADAVAGKRYLLQSPPEITAAITALGVDVAMLGNNHSADWGVAGLASTMRHLDAIDVAYTGAGTSEEEARVPAMVGVDGAHIAVLSYTTVTGSVVNDSLPTSETSPEGSVGDAWQTDRREFSFERFGLQIEGAFLAGDVWQWFGTLDLDGAQESAVWREITATYPELQNWVARWGVGGAAWFTRAGVVDDVAAARADGADLVVVQIHGGYQFSETGSAFFIDSAHAAVDAGADLVVGHHPHVLQGFEWYGDALIAHSLGNFVFDQDFSSTFSSIILRTVYEGDRLLEASVLPVLIVDYRPVMGAGAAAQAILREIRADSTGFAPADKIDGIVSRNLDRENGEEADLEISGNVGVLVGPTEARTTTIDLGTDGTAAVLPGLLVFSDTLAPSVAIGRDLLRWGSFDDVTADGSREGGAQWALADSRRTELFLADSSDHSLALRMEPSRTASALVRPVARVPVPRHRFMDGSGAWEDGEPDYAIRATVRTSGPVTPVVRLDLYSFDDSDPLSDPESDLVGRVEVPLEVDPDAAEWTTIEALVPAGTFDPVDGVTPNAVMIYLQMASGTPSTVEIDDLQLIEWRRADELPDGVWLEVDVIRSTEKKVTLTVR